jgi:hypothetical protein
MADPADWLVPLYAFVRGDTIGLLVLARIDDRVGEVAEQAQRSAGVRVAPRPRLTVLRDGEALDGSLTVRDAGLQPLDRIDVVPEEEVRA